MSSTIYVEPCDLGMSGVAGWDVTLGDGRTFRVVADESHPVIVRLLASRERDKMLAEFVQDIAYEVSEDPGQTNAGASWLHIREVT